MHSQKVFYAVKNAEERVYEVLERNPEFTTKDISKIAYLCNMTESQVYMILQMMRFKNRLPIND